MKNVSLNAMTGRKLRIATSAAILLVLSACGGPDRSPEEQIRHLISESESAAEAGDASVLEEHVSEDYQDQRGYDRRTVLRLAQSVLLHNRNIHLLSVVRDVQVEGGAAAATVLVAMGSRPIESTEALVNVRADLMRFDVEFALEGGRWRARAVDWRRAELNDFL